MYSPGRIDVNRKTPSASVVVESRGRVSAAFRTSWTVTPGNRAPLLSAAVP